VVKIYGLIVLAIVAPTIAQAERNVRYTADFESGVIKPNGGVTDSFFIKTLPDPQVDREVIRTASGGTGLLPPWDSRVVDKASIGGQTIPPRRGKYFARHVLYYGKDYRDLNGGTLEKSRAELLVSHDSNRIDFDTEVYAGFSIFVPNNFEHETGTKGDRGSATLVTLNTDSAATFMTLRVYVPSDENEAHWFIDYPANPYSVTEDRRYKKRVDLGRINADKGKWTDFVIRFRSNPFSVTTNPAKAGIANANDQVYEGNKGIVQLWKAEGPVDGNGNRRMIRKVNVVNSPVGNVPGVTQGKSKLHFGLKIYKYKWQTLSTNVKGPVWFGFDEFRFGEAIKNGTAYSDVHPAQLSCTDGCGSSAEPSEDAPPRPPNDLIIVNSN
jgi:hypothetical protein